MSEIYLFRLNNAPRIILKHSPLVLALCQIRFNSLFGVTQEGLAAFQQSIQSKYPIANGVETIELTIGTDPTSMSIGREQRKIPQWQFTDQDDNWKIVLSQDFLSLETRMYKHFDEFLERLEEAIDGLTEHINPTFITRIGLRYINEIRSKALKEGNQSNYWSDIINEDLLGPLAVPELTEQAMHKTALQQVNLRYANNIGVNVHHGLLSSGTAVQGHKKNQDVSNPFYLLDFDVFQDFILPEVLSVDSEEIKQFVAQYHLNIYQLFRWAVKQDYLSKLED